MLALDTRNLTELEKEMYEKLTESIKDDKNLRIVDAAKICNVSNSKVSKFVRKIGFKNFKEFKLYFSGKEIKKYHSSEIERLSLFLEQLDYEYVKLFVDVIKKYDKIIVFGLGPSYITAQYFCYKLSIVTNVNVSYTQSEDYAYQLADENTLLIVLSVTGKFSTFDDLFKNVKNKNAKVLLLLEEYVNDYQYNVDYLFQLTDKKQDDTLLAFEKTRTLFFIFLEEVVSEISKLTK